ncbi:MAG: hypothetical protein KUG57_09770 [Ilumatobacteraceae bacterium]|nr:hypothetical protein [Ilumatobacteraceae bacterium]
MPSGADPFLFRGGFFLLGVATLMLIAAVTHQGSVANRVLGGRVLLWIGTRSYGLYLYHWPIYQAIRHVAGNSLNVREFAFAMVLTGVITELSYRFVETPIRTGQFIAGWNRFRARSSRGLKVAASSGLAIAAVIALVAGAALVTANVQQNEIAQALDQGGNFTTDLLLAGEGDIPATSTLPATTVATPSTTDPEVTAPTVVTPVGPTTLPDQEATVTTVPDSTVAATTVAPTTAVPTTVPPTTIAPAPLTQLGVINTIEGLVALTIPPSESGFPLVAMGDSVMLGAAEELQGRGFQVDAEKNRQLKNYLPEMAAIRDNGTFGSVVVVHLGTNGGFGQDSFDQMMAILADVPIVLLLTDKADRGWVAGNNDKIRAAPANHPNVTVIDWEALAPSCEGNCLYSDGIHLTQSGQNFYSWLIGTVLGQA